MKKAGYILLLTFVVFAGGIMAGETNKTSVSKEESARAESKVTVVYGVTADDYLPEKTMSARQQVRPKVRKSGSRPTFDFPDAFYFIGGPIFLLILLRVLVIFLNGFEEKQKEEANQMVNEHFNPE